jgi:pyruvate/2-oxoglutarate dehydrogenase complex dihydrolipoamide dehydrogenase (E3) component
MQRERVESRMQRLGVQCHAGAAAFVDPHTVRVRSDMRLLGVHVIGEQAIETVHIRMVAMLADGDAELFNRACFNYPTLGDLYKYATYDALLQTRART